MKTLEQARTLAQLKSNKYGEVFGIFETMVNGEKSYDSAEVSTLNGKIAIEFVPSRGDKSEAILPDQGNTKLRFAKKEKGEDKSGRVDESLDGNTGVLLPTDQHQRV